MSNDELDDRLYQIQIDVHTRYMDDQSSPEDNRYVFSYTITISNQGDFPAKLLNRHWVITDAEGGVEEVRGRGVVGEQPHLAPGERFQYTSGTILKTPVGTMAGSYGMITDEGVEFEAIIPPFSLAIPNILH